ncbi:MAG: succinylglutamate-semialdehyde dehydrogenase, partial [Gammaproteobacteria bacterium]
MLGKNFINNQWVNGEGLLYASCDPAYQQKVWEGNAASIEQVHKALEAAWQAKKYWSNLNLEQRYEYLLKFNQNLKEQGALLAEMISKEMGKPKWEALQEVQAAINKLEISKKSAEERYPKHAQEKDGLRSEIEHKPHGVAVVLGPFNFPLHLPHGHIIPALLAGNTIVFKPSPKVSAVAELYMKLWQDIGLPDGVINLIYGEADIAQALFKHPYTQALYFTGSAAVGREFLRQQADYPSKILALELGGNNPLIIHDLQDIELGAYQLLQAAFITTGQRCTCTRRVFILDSPENRKMFDIFIDLIGKLQIGAWNTDPEPFMGPIIDLKSRDYLLAAFNNLIKLGAISMLDLSPKDWNSLFLRPGILDVTNLYKNKIASIPDQELFGPVLQLAWYDNFEKALAWANHTAYGLAAGLFSEQEKLWQQFKQEIRAGVLVWNRPTTGSSSNLPFGGIGLSGNHRPSAYYAA